MTTKTALINALAAHRGRARGIAAHRLARELGVSPRKLRKLISECRDDGLAICGQPSTGYFMAMTADELNAACAFLENRALHSMRVLARMRKVALPVVAGQLLLNQA